MDIRKARSSYKEEEPRAIDSEVQSMRLRELENAVGEEEKAGVPSLSKNKQMGNSHKAGSQGGGINLSTLSVKDNLLSLKPPKLSKNPGEPSFDAPCKRRFDAFG